MTRRFTEPKLIVASHNQGKVREIGDLMRPFGVETVSAGDLDLPEPEETEVTFEDGRKGTIAADLKICEATTIEAPAALKMAS